MLRYRQRVLCLNYAQELTQGSPLGLSAMLARLDPNLDVFTGITNSEKGKTPLAGQVAYNQGERSAHLTFLMPDGLSELPEHSSLVEYLARKAGEMGALNLLADVQEIHPGFEMLRKNSYSVYCWENVWQLPSALPPTVQFKDMWQEEKETDAQAIRTLYQTVVPPIVQTAEPFSDGPLRRLVYRQDGELMAFTDNLSGAKGFYLRPVIHPSVEDVRSLLGDLIHYLRSMGKPVYFPVRSYQSWVSDTLEELGAKSSPRRALMVKHLAAPILAEQGVTLRKRLESRSAEPTASIVQRTSSSPPSSECN